MEYRNLSDVVAQLRGAGLDLASVKKANGGSLTGEVYVGSTKSVRCDTSDRPGKQGGAYRLREFQTQDGGWWLAGSYWLDHGSTSFKIEINKECAECGADIPLRSGACPACGSKKKPKAREVSADEVAAHKKFMEESRRQAAAADKAAADRAAEWANAVWLTCREVTDNDDHDYLGRKQMAAAHGARLFESLDGVMLAGADKDDYQKLARYIGALVVPMCDDHGRRRGLQFILSRARHKDLIAARDYKDKDYWPRGLANDGLHYVIGGAMHDVGLVCEGFATAASLYEAAGIPVAVAFDAGGVPKVGELIWKFRKKRINLLYCADDDWLQRCAACRQPTPVAEAACAHCGEPHGKGNAGVAKAREAAGATAGAWLIPTFSAPRPADKKGPTDFNDLRCLEGPQPVRAQIEQKLAALEWRMPINGAYGASSSERVERGGGAGGVPPASGRVGSSAQGGGGNSRPDAESIVTLDEAVERFIFIDDDTGDFVFDTVTRNVCKRSKVLKMLPARTREDDMKDHPRWRARAVYIDQIGFDPGGEDKNIVCNRWSGWPTVAKQGKCDLLLELLETQCKGEVKVAREVFEWVLKWLAYPLQHPGAKMHTAIIMHGPQGAGKGRFFETYAKIFGEYGLVLNQEALEDKFNADWQECKLFILADEIVARAEMYHIKNRLKNFVTGEWVRVNPKNVAAHRERNHMQIVFLSNEKQPLVLENDDRRYCVIWTPPPVGKEFFDELSAEIEAGGVAALHWHLLHEVDLGDFKPWTRPPMTEAKRELIDISRDSVDRFLIEWQAGDLDLPFCPCSSADLYRAYLGYCRANGERMPRPENHFAGHIIKLPGWVKAHKDVWMESQYGAREKKRQRMILPSAAALESAPAGGVDFRRKDGEDQAEWLTPCFFAFRSALKVEP